MEDDRHLDSASHSSRVWMLIAVVIVVTLIAIVMVPDKEPSVEAIPMPSVRPEPAAKATVEKVPAAQPRERTLAPEQPSAVIEADAPPAQDGERARRFIQQNKSLPSLLEQAREYQRQGLLGDAWLLYFKAAREGDAQAALALAEQADPAYFDAAKSALSEADVVQAHKWYRWAERYGAAEAAVRLEQLNDYVQQQAEAGNERAMLLIKQWNKN